MAREELTKDEVQMYETIGANINKLIDVSGMTKAKFAEKIKLDAATLSNYTGSARKVPIHILKRICQLKELKDMGLTIPFDTFVNENFDPKSITTGSGNSDSHKDFTGTFMTYFYDQTKTPNSVYAFKNSRPLRCGVISIVPTIHSLTGETIYKAFGLFFDEKSFAAAKELKAKLDGCFYIAEPKEQYKLIAEQYAKNDSSYYGSITFSETHAFLQLESDVHHDKGFCILNSTKKKATVDYLGGLGCVCSISHGAHTPSIQKIVFSRYPLECSGERIGSFLGMEPVKIEMSDEAYAIRDMTKKLVTDTGGIMEYMSDSDKDAIIENRLKQLIFNYIKKNICSVGTISPDEDKEVYDFIKTCIPKNQPLLEEKK